MGDVGRREVVARVRRSSFRVQLETMFVPARVEGLSYPAPFLVYLVDAAADDTEWWECMEIKLMPRPTEGIDKQSIGVRLP